jgi:hypothetical protein
VQKDLEPDTYELATSINTYNPDGTWSQDVINAAATASN